MQKSELLDRLPPNDPAAEKGVLGSMLLDSRRCDDVAAILRPDDFYADANQRLYAHLLGMHDEGKRIDALLLVDRLTKACDLEAIGGTAYIAVVANSVPHAGNVLHYAKIVSDHAKRRRTIAAATEMLQAAWDVGEPIDKVVCACEEKLHAITFADQEAEPVPIAKAAADAIARIDEIQRRGASVGLATGLYTFDNDQGGLFPGELAILAARPGMGKTSLALQIAVHNAECDRLVYFVSLEMSRDELSTRVACGDSGVSNRLVRTGRLGPESARQLGESFIKQGRMKMDIHDRSNMTVAGIRREIRRRVKHGISLAVIDYLQLVTPEDRKLPREQQVAGIIRGLKLSAKEYNIPILCLCQLNRQADDEHEIPRLGHLRESGAIEQDADVVLFLSKHKPTDEEPHNAVLTIAKNRNGETGPLRMDWDATRTLFSCANPANYEQAFD